MLEGQPSQTALQVAAARAAHRRFDPPPHLLDDSIAETLLGPLAEDLIQSYADDGPSWLLRENRLFIPLRARYGEDRLERARDHGVSQLVVLGAGLDSFAFRHDLNELGLQVFEVDHPSTQTWKTARIADLGWALPSGLTFVACDFERQRVPNVLDAAGFRRDEPTFVTWMGVIYYLEKETTKQALADLRSVLAPGSELVFDYQLPVSTLPARYQAEQAKIDVYLARVGEPQGSRYTPDALKKLLIEAGFTRASTESHDALEARYISPLASTIPMSRRFGMAVAEV